MREAIEAKLKKNDPLPNRRIDAAKGHLAFVQNQTVESCNAELSRLRKKIDDLAQQVALTQNRIEYWTNLRDNRDELLVNARNGVKAVQNYKSRQKLNDKIDKLQKLLGNHDIKLEDLRNAFG